MADNTHIEWTDATWNPITGCSVVSPGCTNCYAMKLAGTRLAHHESRAGLTRETKGGPVWTGEVRFNEQWLDQPLRWKKPRMIFVCAHGDLFAEGVPDAWIDQVFAVMALAPHHTFQVLTKRSARMRAYMDCFSGADMPMDRITAAMWTINERRTDHIHGGWPLRNVWLGVSVEDQKRADERIPDLLATPAAVRWISAEPLLGPVSLDDIAIPRPELCASVIWSALRGWGGAPSKINWVVVGGESGPGARPMHPDWVRSLRDQCAEANVPFFFKQWGNWLPVLDRDNDDPDWRSNYRDLREVKRAIINLAGGMGFHGDRVHVVENVGKARAGRLLDGVEHNGFPAVRNG
jgi:protein gp37